MGICRRVNCDIIFQIKLRFLIPTQSLIFRKVPRDLIDNDLGVPFCLPRFLMNHVFFSIIDVVYGPMLEGKKSGTTNSFTSSKNIFSYKLISKTKR